jgi:hypothetical protein
MPIEDSDLMMKILAQRGHALVASPDLAEKAGDNAQAQCLIQKATHVNTIGADMRLKIQS